MEKEQYSNSYRTSANGQHLVAIQPFSSEDEGNPRVRSSQLFALQRLPTPLLPLIGREQEVGAICALLQQPEVRLLTLTGPGGVGKTRLALQISAEVSSVFTEGICFVSLAPIYTPDLVLPTIAQTLGLNERQDRRSLTQVQAAIRDKHFLLLLDNFEHVADAAPQLKELLEACPHLKMLVTSRTVLRLLEEQEFYVAPLTLPDLAHLPPCEDLSQVAAVSLFLQRTHTTRPDFELTSDNAHVVAQICVCLDGLPLALELAAARMKLFSPQSLLTRLGDRLSLLTSGTRDAPERQQTLRKTMEWSYHLLTQEEQCLFRRLSIFVGGFCLQAIEAISHAIDKQDELLLDTLTSLLNQSLLQREAQVGNKEQRFTMLETIREYALECLQNNGEEETVRQAHAEYYLALAKTIKLKVMEAEPSHWIESIESEFENVRAAFGWFLLSRDAERALGMSGALWAFWSQNRTAEGHRWVEQALECCHQSETEVQTELLAEGLLVLAYSFYFQGDHLQACTLGKEGLALSRQTGELYGMMRAVHAQALFAEAQGNGTDVQAMYEEGMAIARATIKMGTPLPIAVCLLGMGAIVALQKQYLWAVRLWGKAEALHKTGDGLPELEPHEWLVRILNTNLLYSQVIEVVHTQLGEQAFTAAWNEGQAMTLEQLLVRPEPQITPTTPSTPAKVAVSCSDGLTPRERDVLRLLAQGLSSTQIAERLVISLATVNTHVRTIYSKLGVSSRSAATRYAIEHHLV